MDMQVFVSMGTPTSTKVATQSPSFIFAWVLLSICPSFMASKKIILHHGLIPVVTSSWSTARKIPSIVTFASVQVHKSQFWPCCSFMQSDLNDTYCSVVCLIQFGYHLLP